MLNIKNNKFLVKFCEMNMKQRLYEGESFVSLEIKTDFYPRVCEDLLISGSINITIDCDIKSINDLNEKVYKDGKVLISLNEDGVWTTYTYYDFSFKVKDVVSNNVSFELELEECSLNETAYVTSLYSVSNKNLSDYFDLSIFYDKPIIKQLSSATIVKYYTNGEINDSN